MANANGPLDFTPVQRAVINKVALLMKLAAAVLLLLGAVLIGGGVWTMLSGSATGLVFQIAGLLTAFLGLVMIATSADVRYMIDTKYASIHLGNAFKSLTTFFKAQALVASFLIVVALIRLLA